LSTPLSERVDSNFNRNENGDSGPGPSPRLDVGDHRHPALTILELGSGTGVIVTKLAEIIDQDVDDASPDNILVATDLENVCPLLDQNLSSTTYNSQRIKFSSSRILVRPLEWGNRNHALKISNELGSRSLTHIICSDLVYFPHLLAPLLRSLIHLTSLPSSLPQPTIIISYKTRSLQKESPFWSAFGLWFTYEPVLYRRHRNSPLPSRQGNRESDHPPRNIRSNEDSQPSWARYHAPSSTYIFIAHRRTASLDWNVPEDDGDLLGGVGAHGDQRRKGDDAFDLMLLMSMVDDED